MNFTAELDIRANEKGQPQLVLTIDDPQGLIELPGANENRADYGRAYLQRIGDTVVLRGFIDDRGRADDFFLLAGVESRRHYKFAAEFGIPAFMHEQNSTAAYPMSADAVDRMLAMLVANRCR